MQRAAEGLGRVDEIDDLVKLPLGAARRVDEVHLPPAYRLRPRIRRHCSAHTHRANQPEYTQELQCNAMRASLFVCLLCVCVCVCVCA